MSGFLVVFHTPSNAGYAMTPLERMFYQVACDCTGNARDVHFAFKDLRTGPPVSLPVGFSNLIALDKEGSPGPQFESAESYIRKHGIDTALCFDLQPRAPVCRMLRNAGVKTLISYWGSTISGLNTGLKLFLKRVEVRLGRHKPDLFIFESEAMRRYAVWGRGIGAGRTCVVPTGVDTDRFAPNSAAAGYVRQAFGIPIDHKIAFYSGHMEARKGVRVIIEAAIELVDRRSDDRITFVLCGNRPGEAQPFLDLLKDTRAASNVVFGGYRDDLHRVIPGCDVGIIASTGWDSFPMSSLEMAACGLPLLVSALQGLVETVEEGVTGFLFEPGNSRQLADRIAQLTSDRELMHALSRAARKRIVSGFTLEHQRKRLHEHITGVMGR